MKHIILALGMLVLLVACAQDGSTITGMLFHETSKRTSETELPQEIILAQINNEVECIASNRTWCVSRGRCLVDIEEFCPERLSLAGTNLTDGPIVQAAIDYVLHNITEYIAENGRSLILTNLEKGDCPDCLIVTLKFTLNPLHLSDSSDKMYVKFTMIEDNIYEFESRRIASDIMSKQECEVGGGRIITRENTVGGLYCNDDEFEASEVVGMFEPCLCCMPLLFPQDLPQDNLSDIPDDFIEDELLMEDVPESDLSEDIIDDNLSIIEDDAAVQDNLSETNESVVDGNLSNDTEVP